MGFRPAALWAWLATIAEFVGALFVLVEVPTRLAAQAYCVPPSLPLLVGGDFNARAGDAAYRLQRPRLEDACAQGGRGCGNTVLNEFPVLRIDQVWISAHSRPVSMRAQNESLGPLHGRL